ncbi:hypothetical protein ACSVC9_10180 [Clostridium sp. LBM24168]
MCYFINELKDKKILNRNDIIVLKNYIDKKYPDYTPVNRADMLSKTIHHILDSNLGQFNESERSRIKFYTLKNTLFKNKDSIFMYDIFTSCISLGSFKQNFIEELLNWLNSNVKNKVQQSHLQEYIKSSKKSKELIPSDNYFPEATRNLSKTIPSSEDTRNDGDIKSYTSKKRKAVAVAALVFSIVIYTTYTSGQILPKNNSAENSDSPIYYAEKVGIYLNDLYQSKYSSNKYPNSNLPYYIKYRPIRTSKLKAFLIDRNSILIKEPYFSTILNTAREYNLNPLLLFAITGQEQNFVPQSEKYAYKIANNPFNVFHSWQEYNTNINDSSKIAARTIINLSKDMPKNADPFLWIGKRYAEDKNWGYGVRSIFKELEK